MNIQMSLARLSIFVALGLFSTRIVEAAVPKTQCANGQVVGDAKCCALIPIIKTIQKDLFEDGACGEDAHSALRLAFHDAIGYSLKGGKGGGADGSILFFKDIETAYHANGNTDGITAAQYPFYKASGLSAGDFVHLAAAVGTANCAGAPRLKFFLGRPPPLAPAPDLTVPEPFHSVDAILERMADAGFNAAETVALLASHSISAADIVDKTIPGTPFDSTVETFDTQIFLEVLLKGTMFPGVPNGTVGQVLSPIRREMRLQSDFGISQDERTACVWQSFINNQALVQSEFKAAMHKLQLLGQTVDRLTDCSDVIPTAAPFRGPIKYPATFSKNQVQIACSQSPFPSLATVRGPAPTLPAM